MRPTFICLTESVPETCEGEATKIWTYTPVETSPQPLATERLGSTQEVGGERE